VRSRFVLGPHHSLAHRERGFGSRVAGAIVFFVNGAIVTTELYPQITADRHAEYNMSSNSGLATSPIPASEIISNHTQKDVAEYIGGPIPQVTFLPTQPPPVAKDTEAASDQDPRASVVAAEKLL
jgi:hypothetical protein